MFRIKFFACSHTGCCVSGKENVFDNIRLYVDSTSFDSKGGLPTRRVYMITPVDHTSTSNEWPFLPWRISGAVMVKGIHQVRVRRGNDGIMMGYKVGDDV